MIGLRLKELATIIYRKENPDASHNVGANKYFANKIGITTQFFNGCVDEQRKIPQKYLIILAEFGINMNWLFTGKGDYFIENNDKEVKKEQISLVIGDKKIKIGLIESHNLESIYETNYGMGIKIVYDDV